MLFNYTPVLVLAFALTSNALAINEHSLTGRDASLHELCGKGETLNTTTLQTADGRALKVTIESCNTPGPQNTAREVLPLARDAMLKERQMPSVCDQTCVQSCHFNGSAAPDCASLISTIKSLDGETFVAPPGTRTIFEVGTCEVSFTHGLTEAVQGCFSWLSPLVVTMNECFSTPPNNEGECFQGNLAFPFDLVLAKSGTF